MLCPSIRPYFDPDSPPAGVKLNVGTVLARLGISSHQVELATGLSADELLEVFSNRWPVRCDVVATRTAIESLAHAYGASEVQLSRLWMAYRHAEAHAMPVQPRRAAEPLQGPPKPAPMPSPRVKWVSQSEGRRRKAAPEVKPMLLPKQTLSPAARKHFSLSANPFDGEVTVSEEMFCSDEMRFVREACWQAAVGGRFVAVVGESGSGKTTLLADLKERIAVDRKPVTVIEPSVLGMEETNSRGKVLKAADILTAIVMTLAPACAVSQTSEKRTRQAEQLLAGSTTAGRAHLLLIEEAHALPVATLKHLKRLHERMRLNGRKPMLGILLLGQPELMATLQDGNHAVREVIQRLELIQLQPLDHDLRAYLAFRASKAGCELDQLVTPEAVDAIRSRLTVIRQTTRGRAISMVYPLAVNNLATACLNTAAQLGLPRVTADVVQAI